MSRKPIIRVSPLAKPAPTSELLADSAPPVSDDRLRSLKKAPPHLARPVGLAEIPGLEGRLSVHDRHQCELSWTYAASSRKRTRYRLDVYFFLPAAIGVTSDSYDRSSFFSDTQAYIRLVPPRLSVKRLVIAERDSPLSELEEALRSMPEPRDPEALVHQAKLTGCVARGAIRRQRRKLLQACATERSGSKLQRKAEEFCTTMAALLNRLRRVEAMGASERMVATVAHVDDFLSMLGVEAACDALDGLQNRDEQPCDPARDTLAAFVSTEIAYRRSRSWPSLQVGCPAEQLEHMMYRRSYLKKFVFGSLFLNVRHLKSGNVVQHMVGAIGASIAAVWAFFSNPALFGSVTINSLTFAVLFVAVSAYILKDRLKEITKQYLSARMRYWLPDRDRQILPSGLASRGTRPIGRIREYIDFVAPSKLDPDIHKLRNAVHTVDVGEDAVESILHYAKIIDLRPYAAGASTRDGIKDILRFSVRHLLTRLDESPDVLHAFDPETRGAAPVEGGHVYHVNVVVRHVAHGPDSRPQEPVLERIRLILQKSGIVRVEPVVVDQAQEGVDDESAGDETD